MSEVGAESKLEVETRWGEGRTSSPPSLSFSHSTKEEFHLQLSAGSRTSYREHSHLILEGSSKQVEAKKDEERVSIDPFSQSSSSFLTSFLTQPPTLRFIKIGK